jgi:hypothetical protein
MPEHHKIEDDFPKIQLLNYGLSINQSRDARILEDMETVAWRTGAPISEVKVDGSAMLSRGIRPQSA